MIKPKTLLAIAVGTTLSLSVPQALAAEQSPLLEELRVIVEKSRQQRAADRWLQGALEDLLAKHDTPWQRDILYEDFRDGDYERDPNWQVLRGDFRVIRGQGLYASADAIAGTPAPANGTNNTPQSPSDALSGLIVGALLDQALGPRPSTAPQGTSAPAASGGPAEIRVQAGVSNAFAVELGFRVGTGGEGGFEVALMQSENGQYGYRLYVDSGARGMVELQRVRRGNGAVVDSQALGQPLNDGRLHDLRWQQGADGTVTVALDGKNLFSVRDRAFRDPYPWLHLRIDRGELTVRSLRISGA